MKRFIEGWGIAAFVGAMIGLIAWPALGTTLGPVGRVAAVGLGLAAAWFVSRRVPQASRGPLDRHPVLLAVWCLIAVTALVQTARLGAHMEDPERSWWVATRHPFWSKHACMTAYVYAADLQRQGEPDIYDASHYPGLTRDAVPHPTIANLVPEDPFQYPPTFLLLPRLAIALSNDYRVIRAVWFSMNAFLFLLVAFLLARWFGGSSGTVAMALIPLVWISVPSLLNFQYGQFHVATLALAMAAFLALEGRHHSLGGALLASAILAKGFPAIVLIPLLLRRQYRALSWTAAWAAALGGLAWAVLGREPFEAFAFHHLARLQSGAAFAFEDAWPEVREWLLAGNLSPFAMIRKLGELGMASATEHAARVVHGIASLGFLGIAALATRFETRQRRAIGWLALLNLAALTSPAAWGDYVPLGTLWMLTFMVAGRDRARMPVLAVAGGFCFAVPGVVPIGSFPAPQVAVALSILATPLLVAVNGWAAVRDAVSLVPRTARSIVLRPSKAS